MGYLSAGGLSELFCWWVGPYETVSYLKYLRGKENFELTLVNPIGGRGSYSIDLTDRTVPYQVIPNRAQR